MEELKEIECQICGTFFISNMKTRKYCEKCSPNSDKKKFWMERDMERSLNRTFDLQMSSHKCAECGCEFTIPTYLREKLSVGTHVFCCYSHMDKYDRRQRTAKGILARIRNREKEA